MALNSKRNLIVGAAQVWLAAGDATVPAPESGKSYNETLAGSSVAVSAGFTQEGVELSFEPEYTDINVDQQMDAAKTFQSGLRVSVNTTFAEATLYNLMVAWGQVGSTLTSTASDATLVIKGVGLGEAPVERQLVVVGNGPDKADGQPNERYYTAHRALSVNQVTTAMRKTEAQAIPISFRLLPGDDGTYGIVRDRQRTW